MVCPTWAAARHGGIAAVPLNPHGQTIFEPDGVPRCPVDLRMHPTYQYVRVGGYRAQIYRCPLYFPQRRELECDHPQFRRTTGCVKHINIEPGGLQRVLLDRKSAHYKDLYRQRTCCERINSQAQALGIERAISPEPPVCRSPQYLHLYHY